MSLNLTEITAEEYYAISPHSRIVVHDHARRYCLFDLPNIAGPLGICWRSDLIEPFIMNDPSGVWIGVDERLVCVAQDGSMLFSIGLASTFLDGLISAHGFIAMCQTEIVVVNTDFSIRAILHVPEIADALDIGAAVLTVTCIDGTVHSFQY